MASPGNQHSASCIGALSFPTFSLATMQCTCSLCVCVRMELVYCGVMRHLRSLWHIHLLYGVAYVV